MITNLHRNWLQNQMGHADGYLIESRANTKLFHQNTYGLRWCWNPLPKVFCIIPLKGKQKARNFSTDIEMKRYWTSSHCRIHKKDLLKNTVTLISLFSMRWMKGWNLPFWSSKYMHFVPKFKCTYIDHFMTLCQIIQSTFLTNQLGLCWCIQLKMEEDISTHPVVTYIHAWLKTYNIG